MNKEQHMKKEIGLWIDHRKAVVVTITDAGEEIQKIVSGMEKHVRFTAEDGLGEDSQDRKFGNHLNSYYDEVVAIIRDADSVQIFGPGEAKGELAKRLENEGLNLNKKRILAVEAADKMTDRQIAAKVRERFPV
jgi:stalled ribosome rescue protein Dom34